MFELQKTLQFIQGQTRRDFFKGLGAGALGLSALGGRDLFAAEPPIESPADDWGWDSEEDTEETERNACSVTLWSVDRQARLLGQIQVTKCTPCNCPIHQTFHSELLFQTTFDPVSPCDELAAAGIIVNRIRWTIRNRFLRVPGPCNSPVGVFEGSWNALDPASVVVIRGNIRGTLGFDPCQQPGALRCCQYPHIVGTLSGDGRPGTPADDCVARLSFCGIEGTVPCQPSFWDVGITGLLRCRC
jgi:hypothetical protein